MCDLHLAMSAVQERKLAAGADDNPDTPPEHFHLGHGGTVVDGAMDGNPLFAGFDVDPECVARGATVMVEWALRMAANIGAERGSLTVDDLEAGFGGMWLDGLATGLMLAELRARNVPGTVQP